MARVRRPMVERPAERRALGSAPPLLARLRSFLELQRRLFTESFLRIRAAPWPSILTIVVIAVALALPMALHALTANLRSVGEQLDVTGQISLFLKPNLSNEAGRKLMESLERRADIAAAKLITKEAGLEELRSYGDFDGALKVLDANPLPVVVSLTPKDTAESLDKLAADLKALPEADFVQADSAWLEKLRAILDIVRRTTLMFGVLLCIGVLFIVGNTIRLELQTRHQEIAVSRLLGASNSFIRFPFLYTGFWYGALGGLTAWVLVNLLLLLLRSPAEKLAELYASPYQIAFLGLPETELLLGVSAILGVCGAFVAVNHHLRQAD